MRFNRQALLAALYALGAFSFWVGTDSLNKLASETLPITQRCFLNQGVAGLVFLLFSFRGAGLAELKTKKPWLHVARGLINCANVVTLLYSVQHLPLANFYAIAFTSPFMIALVSWLFLKEKIGLGLWVAILVGFAGVLVSINPQEYDPNAWGLWPVLSMIVANLCYAFYAITVKTGGQNETATALTFYPECAAATAYGIAMLGRGEWVSAADGVSYSVISGILNGLAVLLIVAAYRTGKNSFVASFHYSQIVMGGIVGFLLWGDVPTKHLLGGVALIIAAGLYVIWSGASEKEEPPALPAPQEWALAEERES